jgi:hypothetical protein
MGVSGRPLTGSVNQGLNVGKRVIPDMRADRSSVPAAVVQGSSFNDHPRMVVRLRMNRHNRARS